MSNTTDFTTLKPGQVDKEIQKLVDDGIELPELPDKAAKVAFLTDFYSTADKPEAEEGAEPKADAPADGEAATDGAAETTDGSEEANKWAEDDQSSDEEAKHDDTIADAPGDSEPAENTAENTLANPVSSGLPRKPFQPEENVVDNGPELKSYMGATVLRVEDQLIFGNLNKRIVCSAATYVVSVDEYENLVANQ